jgi:hypothetical protein
MRGRFSKSASVFTNDPKKEKVKVVLSGKIIPFILLEPDNRIRLHGFLDEEIKGKVTITANLEQPLIINEIKSKLKDKITYKLKTLEKNRKYELEVISVSDVPARYSKAIEIHTNYKKKPIVQVFINCNVKGEVSVFPGYINFGMIKIKDDLIELPDRKEIIIKKNRGIEDLTIKQVICSLSFIATNLKKINNKRYRLIVDFKKDEVGKEEFSGEIIVKTNSKITPEVIIKVYGKII